MNQLQHTNGDVGGRGRDPKKQQEFCTVKKTNLISGGRMHLLQHYWYKVPVLHILKYHEMFLL